MGEKRGLVLAQNPSVAHKWKFYIIVEIFIKISVRVAQRTKLKNRKSKKKKEETRR